MFAAWFGGVAPGLLATALSILAFDYYFIPPADSFAITFKSLSQVVLFAVVALFAISLSAAQRGAAESFRRTRDDLQVAVQELERLNKALQSEGAERKRAEQKIRDAERELQLTIDTIPTMAASYRSDGPSDFVNKTWRDYYGPFSGQLDRQPMGRGNSPGRAPHSRARMARSFEDRRTISGRAAHAAGGRRVSMASDPPRAVAR
jgi:PAS domain-containing protein